jgi:hypothetical protein
MYRVVKTPNYSGETQHNKEVKHTLGGEECVLYEECHLFPNKIP